MKENEDHGLFPLYHSDDERERFVAYVSHAGGVRSSNDRRWEYYNDICY